MPAYIACFSCFADCLTHYLVILCITMPLQLVWNQGSTHMYILGSLLFVMINIQSQEKLGKITFLIAPNCVRLPSSEFFLAYFLQINLCQKLFFLLNMGRTCCVQKLFWMSETISVHNMFSPGLSLEFSCIELVIQWKIWCHIVG